MSPRKALLKLTRYEMDVSETEFYLFAQRLFSTVFATALCGCYGVKKLHFIEKNGVLCTYCCSLACLLDDSICSPKAKNWATVNVNFSKCIVHCMFSFVYNKCKH